MKRFRNILYASGPDLSNAAAFERAATLAQNNQARLTVVEVIDEIPSKGNLLSCALSVAELQENIAAEHRDKLEELLAHWRKSVEITIKVIAGIPFLEIIRAVLSDNCDLLIKTAENGGLFDKVFGSDDMHLLRKCPCPVWLVKSISPRVF